MPGETVEIAISIGSLQGFIDKVYWDEPIIKEGPKLDLLTYNKDLMRAKSRDRSAKIYCDLNRICELEDAVVEWYEEKYYTLSKERVDLKFLEDAGFQIKSVHYAGVEGAICKAELIVQNSGIVEKERLGLDVFLRGDSKSQIELDMPQN